MFKAWFQLQAESLKIRLDLIRADLDVLFTFADLAETQCDLDHHEQAEQSLLRAEQGYVSMLRLFSQTTGMSAAVQVEFRKR